MPGRLIAVAAGCVFVALIIYGISFDARHWLEERLWRRDEQRAEAQLDEELERRIAEQAEPLRDELDYFAELCGLFAPTAAAISSLRVYRDEDWRVLA